MDLTSLIYKTTDSLGCSNYPTAELWGHPQSLKRWLRSARSGPRPEQSTVLFCFRRAASIPPGAGPWLLSEKIDFRRLMEEAVLR